MLESVGEIIMNNRFQILATIILMSICSCSKQNSATEYSLSGIPFEDNDSSIYGLIDLKFNIIATGFEDAVSPVINGFFFKENGEGSQVLCKVDGNTYKELTKTSGYDNFGVMNNGLIPACKENENIVILDEFGDIAFTLGSYDDSEVIGCASYSSGILRVNLMNGSVIYLDTSGNKLFDTSYSYGTDFINDKAIISSSDGEFSLINGDGEIIFSFIGESEDDVKISHEFKLVCSKDEDDIVTVYDFQGNTVCKCPKKVEEVYSFGKDCFVFKKGYYYGLMNYEGIELIRAKYDQLVFNGTNILAIHEDRDDEVLILDLEGNIVGTLDGEEIYSAKEFGFDFPNIIKREDDEIYLIDEKCKIVGPGSLDIGIDLDDLEYVSNVRNMYFPKNEVLKIVMDLCGNGTGLPANQGVYYFNGNSHCSPKDVRLLSDCPKDKLIGQQSFSTTISEGVNYSIDFEVSFDEPIIRENTYEFNSYAWLKGMRIIVSTPNMFQNAAFFNLCRKTLEDSYDCEVTASYKNKYVLTSNDQKNLMIFVLGKGDYFNIYLRERNESTLSYWTNYIRK